jgi:hypothetical protein
MLSHPGFTEEEVIPTPATIQAIQEIGQTMAKSVNARLSVVDAIFWVYGTGIKAFVDWKPSCLKGIPLCLENRSACDLTRYCRYYLRMQKL